MTEFEQLQQDVRRLEERSARAGYAVLWALAFAVLSLVLAVVITVRINESTQRKFCDVVASQSSPVPTTTGRGADIARKLELLSKRLGCPDVAPAPIVTPSTYGYPTETP